MKSTLELVSMLANDDVLNNLHKRKKSILLSILPDVEYSREHGGLKGIYDEKTQGILDEIDLEIGKRQFKIERLHFSKS